MSSQMTWSEWQEKYKPINNKFSKYESITFETYGDEVDFVQAQDPRYVWTLVTGDMSDLIVAGRSFVNRMCYYVTEIPWEDENEYVLISVEEECECYDEERIFDRGEAGDPECEKCEGYGLVTKYVD